MAVALTLPLFQAQDPNGDPLAGGKLYSFEAGSSTPKALYQDAAGQVAHANPVILNAAGQAIVYGASAGLYKLDLFSAADAHQPDWPLDNLVFVAEDSGYTNVRSLGLYGDGAHDDALALLQMQGELPPGCGLFFPGPGQYWLNSDVTLSVPCRFQPGASLLPGLDFTVTFATTAPIEAPPTHIFDLSLGGSVVFPEGRTVWAEWYGAKADNSTDAAPALRAALHAAADGMVVRTQEGVYRIGSLVDTPTGEETGVKLLGMSKDRTIFRRTTGYAGPLIRGGDGVTTITHIEVAHCTIDGIDAAADTVGLLFAKVGQYHVHDVTFRNLALGWQISGSSYHMGERLYFVNNERGMTLDNDLGTIPTFGQFNALRFRNCRVVALTLDASFPSGGSRRWNFVDCAFEGHTNTSGTDIGTLIKETGKIRFVNCWWEANSQHVVLQGSDEIRPLQKIVWLDCEFAQQNAAGAALDLFAFGGTATLDGAGCMMERCSLRGGTYQFDQTIPVRLLEMDLETTSTIRGNVFFDRSGIVSALHTHRILHRGVDEDGIGNEPDGIWMLDDISQATTTQVKLTRNQRMVTEIFSNAGTFTLHTIATSPDDVCMVETVLVSRASGAAHGAAYKVWALFRNVAGTVSKIGATVTPFEQETEGHTVDWVAVSGNISLQITQAVAASRRWWAFTTQYRIRTNPAPD